jgi:hypothetical protein
LTNAVIVWEKDSQICIITKKERNILHALLPHSLELERQNNKRFLTIRKRSPPFYNNTKEEDKKDKHTIPIYGQCST